MFETFDHTADVGLRIRSSDLNSLFAEAAKALTAVLLGDSADVAQTHKIAVCLEADDPVDLMHDWLAELHFYYETERFVCARAEVVLSDRTGLTATVFGETLDPSRHEIGLEIKAITYHGLKVEESEQGWLCEVILDL